MDTVVHVEEEEPVMWRSCCMSVDKDAAVYLSGFTMIASTTVFCFYQLMTKDGCSDQQAYLSVLTMMLGIFLPQPNIKRT
jgi:hypothetical protein